MDDIMAQGLTLMATGMGVVLAFLLILVAVMFALSAIIMRFAPEPSHPAPSDPTPADSGRSAGDLPPPAIMAAIQEALRQHRTPGRS